jgi:hypothetical protein
MTRISAHLAVRLHQLRDDDRGDVPGWVFITIMTAGLVTTLWLVAEDQLREIFSAALSRVSR